MKENGNNMKKTYITIFIIFLLRFSLSAEIDNSFTASLLNKSDGMIREYDSSSLQVWNNPREYIKLWNIKLDSAFKTGDNLNAAIALNQIGLGYSYINDYDKALKFYFNALKIYESENNIKGIAELNNNIGLIYKYIRSHSKAKEYYEKALELFQQVGDKKGIANSLTYIGNIYYHRAEYEPALKNFEEALKIFEEIKDNKGITFPLNNIGTIYNKMNNPQKAEYYFFRSYSISLNNKNNWDIANALNNLADVSISLNNHDSALYFINKSLIISKEINYQDVQLDSYKFLCRLYQKIGNTMKYLENYKELSDVRYSLFNEEISKNISDLQIKYETEKKEMENNILKLKQEKQQLTIYFLILIIFVILIFIVQLKKAYNKVRQQKDILFILNHEKNEFLGIASHDLKNPLTSIVMASDIILDSSIDSSSRILVETIKRSADKMTMLIDNLLNVNKIETTGISLKIENTDIMPILTKLKYDYESKAYKKNIQLQTEWKETPCIAYCDKNAFEQIADNLISNAVKYTESNKKITIKLFEVSNNICLEVLDEGQGISETEQKKLFGKFMRLSSKTTGGEHSTGLGLYIVKKLADAMGCEILCSSELNKGSVFRLKLKKGKYN